MRFRFAPSPTGVLHIGGARTALYNWLAARGEKGVLVLRLEDTDPERSTDENIASILEALEWLELDWDEGPLRQTDQEARHRECVQQLLDSDRAYRDPASAEEVAAWKKENGNRGYRGEGSDDLTAAVRLRVPDEGETVVRDEIHGDVTFPNSAIDDFVIARSDGSPLYNLAVAIDDLDMEITDVVRGDDHLSNTPKQVLVIEALEAAPPRYAHLPLLHGPDGKKLSKRHGADSVQALRDAGYLPEAVRNYMALLGWGTDDDETLLSTDELVARFRVDRVGKAAAIFDEQKLRWMNGRYMRDLDIEGYTARVATFLDREPDEELRAACAMAQEKAQTLAEVWPLVGYLFEEPTVDEKAWKKVMKPGSAELLEASRSALEELDTFEVPEVEEALEGVVEAAAAKPGAVYQPIRVALTGGSVSPGIFETVSALGRERSLGRLSRAIERRRAEEQPAG
jgi:glutamyl-tRNA synthetase